MGWLGLNLGASQLNERMWSAAADGDIDEMRSMLRWGASPDATFVSGTTALQVAVYNNQIEAAKFLIKAGADVNRPTPDGGSLIDSAHTPEMRAVVLAATKGK